MKFDAKSKTFPFVKLNGDTVKVPVLYSAKYKLAMQYVPALMAQVTILITHTHTYMHRYTIGSHTHNLHNVLTLSSPIGGDVPSLW